MRKILRVIAILLTPGFNALVDYIERVQESNEDKRKVKRMAKAIEKAKRKAKGTGKTHYVLIDYLGYPYVASRSRILELQKDGYYKRKKTFDVAELLKEAVFIAKGKNSDVVR